MQASRWNERFFESTRGRIVLLLRHGSRTVSELVEKLGLSDNAIRAHLATLERDGLVQQRGVTRGSRKPHLAYVLASNAKILFPQADAPLLERLLDVLAGRLDEQQLEAVLRETGHQLAQETVANLVDALAEERIPTALRTLRDLGGVADLEVRGDKTYIRGYDCPLASLVPRHPEVCRLVETLLADITGSPVQETCQRGSTPHCLFEIIQPASV